MTNGSPLVCRLLGHAACLGEREGVVGYLRVYRLECGYCGRELGREAVEIDGGETANE